LLCHNGKWLRVKGKVSLNKAYYFFVNIIYHAQVTPGSGINPIFILDGLVKSPSIPHSGRVRLSHLVLNLYVAISDHNYVVKRDAYLEQFSGISGFQDLIRIDPLIKPGDRCLPHK
jgi:hypothetical protein